MSFLSATFSSLYASLGFSSPQEEEPNNLYYKTTSVKGGWETVETDKGPQPVDHTAKGPWTNGGPTFKDILLKKNCTNNEKHLPTEEGHTSSSQGTARVSETRKSPETRGDVWFERLSIEGAGTQKSKRRFVKQKFKAKKKTLGTLKWNNRRRGAHMIFHS